MRYTVIPAPFGSVGLVATPRGLARMLLLKRPVARARAYMAELFPQARHDARLLPALRRQLGAYFSGRAVRLGVRLDLSHLTPFQRNVLTACARIGHGQTTTYAQLARRIGWPQAARAVGGALARNPLPLVIPCHRVVAADGALGGFSAEQGVSLKKWLLQLEGSIIPAKPASVPGHRKISRRTARL